MFPEAVKFVEDTFTKVAWPVINNVPADCSAPLTVKAVPEALVKLNVVIVPEGVCSAVEEAVLNIEKMLVEVLY